MPMAGLGNGKLRVMTQQTCGSFPRPAMHVRESSLALKPSSSSAGVLSFGAGPGAAGTIKRPSFLRRASRCSTICSRFWTFSAACCRRQKLSFLSAFLLFVQAATPGWKQLQGVMHDENPIARRHNASHPSCLTSRASYASILTFWLGKAHFMQNKGLGFGLST